MRADLHGKSQRTCDDYRRSAALGESITDFVGRVSKDEGVNRPAVWRRLRAGGVLPPYKSSARKYPHKPVSQYKAKQPEALPPTVDRDPCPRCGTRGDIGCSHSRVRLGTAFGVEA